jgi:hypothetical protein
LTGNGHKPSRALKSTLKVFPGTREAKRLGEKLDEYLTGPEVIDA